ncbi:MAG: hypothetical protein QOF10_1178 [Kribbellaceae bacterium]|nr:hypothetical protein [Kribbellaceae bacterium]
MDWTQCRAPSQEYEYDGGQLQAEVNAAIDGALGVEQRDEKLVAIRTDDPLRLFRTWIAAVMLSREGLPVR